MNIKHIETFYWAARLGSFVQAAMKLNATQSGISMRIQELEKQWGAALFDRSRRSAKLTSKGALLLPFAEDLLLAAERLRVASTPKDKVVGYIRLGVTETVALTWLPSLFRQIRDDFPGIRVELEIALSHVVEEKLQAGLLDMAFAACEVSSLGFISTPLEKVQFVWVCSPLLSGIPDVVTPDHLSELPIITTSREWQFRGATLDWIKTNEIRFRDLTICNTFRTAASLAIEGVGLAYVPELLYREDIRQGRLRSLRCTPENAPLQTLSIRPIDGIEPSHLAIEEAAVAAISAYQNM